MDIKKFKAQPVMGILRGAKPDSMEPLVEAVISAGLNTLEITMNTEAAPELIKKAVRVAGKRLIIGAGTVLNKESLKSALSAGAEFIVSPVLVKEVTGYCLKNKIPVFPGALTPQEAYQAWNEGATMVKVFPAGIFGPGYFRELKGPFQDIQLLACGGVTPQNLKAYFANGANAVAFGGSVFKQELLEKKDFTGIARLVRAYLRALPEHLYC